MRPTPLCTLLCLVANVAMAQGATSAPAEPGFTTGLWTRGNLRIAQRSNVLMRITDMQYVRPGRSVSKDSTQVRRETGRKERVQVPYDEGRANHIGPKSCATVREGRGEALTGELLGQPLSHVTKSVRDADAVCVAEGNTVGCANASALPIPRGLRPWHASDTSCTGTGRSQVWPRRQVRSASGRLEGRS